MGLFHDIKYFLVSSLPLTRQEQLEYALSKNGATKADSLVNATHIVTDSLDFTASDSKPDNVAVVSDYWVDRSLVLGKIQPPQYYSADPAMIFSGVVACAAELPSHDLEVLSAGITALGGQWRIALTNDVTHLFAVSKNSIKYASAVAHGESTGVKIVLPHWFDDSVRLGIRRLPVEPYLWPDPPLLKDIRAVVKEENKSKIDIMATANKFTPAQGSRVPLPKDVDLMPVKKDAWNGKKVLLSWTLTLYGSRREAVEAGIRRAGGEILRYPGDQDDDLSTEGKEKQRDKKEARAVVECDILITRWRNGRAYGKAFRLRKTIGTMAWLYHVQSTGLIPRPVDQLLHYPIPRRPIENFSKHEITVTNYTGEAREYIKRLISAMGATFTPSMTGKNTVLIAAYVSGQKAEKARAWSISVVNHTWLEDCFIQWRHLTTATEKYITFPPGMDFSRLLCERGVSGRGVELCDEEEAREDESDVDSDFDIAKRVDREEEEDDVLKRVVEEEEDIDMINMPYTNEAERESPVNHRSPSKANGKLTYSTRAISESVSPSKRNTYAASPVRPKSKSVSPAKRKQIVEADDELVIDRQESDHEEIVRRVGVTRPRKPKATEAEEDDMAGLLTPAKKAAVKAKGSSSRKARDSSVDLALSDDDSELEKTPPFYRSPVKSKGKGSLPAKNKLVQEELVTELERSVKKTVTRRVESSGEDEDEAGEQLPAPGLKRRLVRRLTNEASLQLAQEREKEQQKDVSLVGPATAKRLVHRASGQPVTNFDHEHEKEDLSSSPAPLPEIEKGTLTQRGLLKLRRGDARTRVKAKGAAVKEKELVYSDSEDEVMEIVEPAKVVGKGKAKAKKRRAPDKGRKSKMIPSEIEESTPVESEDESDEEEPPVEKMNPPAHVSPFAKKVSVVVNSPPFAAKPTPKATYAGRGKKKTAIREESPWEEETQCDPAPSLKKTESIHIEAGEKASSSKSRSSPIKKNTHSTAKFKSRLRSRLEASPPPPISPLSTTNNDPPTDISEPPAKRGAAAKAEAKLKQMMPDATKYEQEVKKARKSGGWLTMWENEYQQSQREGLEVGQEEAKKRRASEDQSEQEEPIKKRRKSNPYAKGRGKIEEEEEEEEEAGQVEVVITKGRTRGESESGKMSAKIRLMTTQASLPPDAIKGLEKLGVVFTSRPSQCTHLLASNLVRTEKLLCALAVAPFVLDPSWAIDSAREKQILPVHKYMLKDTAAEAKYRLKLGEVLTRAKKLKGTLLAQNTFYVTAKTKVNYTLLRSVVTAHGGQLVQQSPTARVVKGYAHRHVISCPEDISIWRPLSAQGIPIFTHEFLLIGVLKQELEWDCHEFRVQGSLNS